MKKFFSFILVVLAIKGLFAQTFSGVPIGGTIEQMKVKLMAKGYKFDEKKDNVIWLNGKMAAKNVTVGLFGTYKTKTNWQIVVIFNPQNSWNLLKDEFYDTKNILTKKYGYCNDSFEFFSSPYTEGEGDELLALQSEKVTYAAYWENLEKGKLDLSIEIGKNNCVVLKYQNNQNSKLFQKEKEDLELNSY